MELQRKGKPETNEEVRDKGKQREREQLANYLTCKWQYANSTAYSKAFRKYKLLEMINEITYNLLDESGQLSVNERYMLLSLIRAISDVIDGKTSISKRVLEMRLNDFTELSESA